MTEKSAHRLIWLGLAAALLSVPAVQAADTSSAKPDCAVSEFTMGLRFQQQSAEIQALQLQAGAALIAGKTLILDPAVGRMRERSGSRLGRWHPRGAPKRSSGWAVSHAHRTRPPAALCH